ncbi:MAG: biopolymer transporter ExbD [Planctomycetes bacterium]|nr:biopolymer transporter ExbD [Planctomycetota bacterium]
MKIRAANDEEPVLNLTPMIDVVFQLLIFFMVATTFLDPEKEIGIELPEAVSGTTPEAERTEIVINVFADGRVVLAGRELTADDLLDALRGAASADQRTPVTIRGDQLTPHKNIVAVMDACARAGLGNLSVGTLEGS